MTVLPRRRPHPARRPAPHLAPVAYYPHERAEIDAAARTTAPEALVARIEALHDQHKALEARYQQARFEWRARTLHDRLAEVWVDLHWHLTVRRAQVGLLPVVDPTVGPVLLPSGDDLAGQ